MSVRDDFAPPFSSVTEVQRENAMIDRFEVEFGDWALNQNEDNKREICNVLNHLDYYTVRTSRGTDVQLFAGASLRSLRSKIGIPFASGGSGSGPYSPRPIVSGKLVKAGKRQAEFRNAPSRFLHLSFQTSLNLGRFIQAQKFRKTSRPHNPILDGAYCLAIERCNDWHEKEMPLVPASNLIMGQVHRFGYARRHSLDVHLQDYLSSVSDALADCLEPPLNAGGIEFIKSEYRSLRSIEIYWEFSDADPIGLVSRLIQPLRRLSYEVSLTREILDRYREEVDTDSWCITLALTADIRLRVYAKTTQRVRFEIEFSAAAIDDICERRTAHSNQGIASMVASLLEYAVEEVNWVLSELNREIPQVASQNTAAGLIHEISTRIEDRGTGQAIVSLLQTFGRVAPRENEPMRQAVHKLSSRHAGVLKTIRPYSSVYVVTEAWEAALEELQALGNTP